MEIIIRNLREIKRVVLYVIVVIILSLFADAVVEWRMADHPMLYIKDLINIAIILIATLFYRLDLIKLKVVLAVAVYSIFISIYLSIPVRLESNSLVMEAYFVKVELITILLMLVAGILIHRHHMIYVLVINAAFIITCMIFLPVDYPASKYIFYLVLLTGAGLSGQRLQKALMELRENLAGANAEIAKNNKKLIEVNKQKDQLFRIIGHDIRTPFNQISMVLSILSNDMDNAKFEEMKKAMETAVDNGNLLLQDLMIWAKAQATDSMAVKETVPLFPLIQKEVRFFEGQAKRKSVQINNQVQKGIKVFADPNMTATIIRNFISNALKFSHRDSTIEILIDKNEGFSSISVKDYGTGMKPEDLEKLRYSEKNVVSQEGTEKEAGTGFGVRICQKLAEHQGGKVKITSEWGKGSTFSLILPPVPLSKDTKPSKPLES
ncbi:sensor histidine kinase [Echinicola vietnamensis]|uniref:histidine kinase n=1 Tax=Echinicola vietnamensis (strain DSM 17526 / LMG 23754 / KMM 6221) TaxID=926556 RepID=L0FVV8_ECHVK|nr:HAMP domain-containing sensor histidine kinase [Echinicola vietnamensis]AGA77163.1 signal transduction histidine kinase [Echinicola vietnamensis DSM 17526]